MSSLLRRRMRGRRPGKGLSGLLRSPAIYPRGCAPAQHGGGR